MGILDIDKFAVELHDPDITEPNEMEMFHETITELLQGWQFYEEKWIKAKWTAMKINMVCLIFTH